MYSNINPRSARNRTPDPGPRSETGAIRQVMGPRRPVLHTENSASDSWASTASTTAWSTDCNQIAYPDKENYVMSPLAIHETPQSSRLRGARRPSPERRRPISIRTPLQDYSQSLLSDFQPRTPLATRVYRPDRVVRSPETPHTAYEVSPLPFEIIAVPMYGCQTPVQDTARHTPAGRNEFRAWCRTLQESIPPGCEVPSSYAFSPSELALIKRNIEEHDRRERLKVYTHLKNLQDRKKYNIFNVLLGIDSSHDIPETYEDISMIDDVSVDLVDSNVDTVNGDHDTSRSAYTIEASNDSKDLSSKCLTPPHNGAANNRQAGQDAARHRYDDEALLQEWHENGRWVVASPMTYVEVMQIMAERDPEKIRLYRLTKLE